MRNIFLQTLNLFLIAFVVFGFLINYFVEGWYDFSGIAAALLILEIVISVVLGLFFLGFSAVAAVTGSKELSSGFKDFVKIENKGKFRRWITLIIVFSAASFSGHVALAVWYALTTFLVWLGIRSGASVYRDNVSTKF